MGTDDGALLGSCDGLLDGILVGFLDGLDDGLDDGRDEGIDEGFRVGCLDEGLDEGRKEGALIIAADPVPSTSGNNGKFLAQIVINVRSRNIKVIMTNNVGKNIY